MENDKITRDEMFEAIKNSGYLIEQRVEPVFSKLGYVVETNDAYQDDETGKTREIDLTATKIHDLFDEKRSTYDFLQSHIIAECENNKQPIVFFDNRTEIDFVDYSTIKISGIPLDVYPNSEFVPISLKVLFNFRDFHHYFKGPITTQYCSFQITTKQKKWIALHNEEQHGSFNNLVKFIQYSQKEFPFSYTAPLDDQNTSISLELFYPLIILQGDLFIASMVKNELELKPREHIQFRKQIIKNNKPQYYHIDVITESFLPKYLKIIDKENSLIFTKIKKYRALLCKSKSIIVKNLNMGVSHSGSVDF